MALEAIYGDDLAVFENKEGLRYFQVSCAAMSIMVFHFNYS
jgi:hypothetical protein